MRFWTKTALLFLFSFSVISTYAQNKKLSDTGNNSIVAEFKGEKISTAEFESAFHKVGIPKMKNNADSLVEKQKFLQLYVNYKMKLKDALQRGFDKDPEVLKEIAEYRKSIGSNMLVEKEITAPAINNLYEKRKIEIRISQIVVKYDSTQADLGFSKAENIFNKVKAGENFEELVKQFSDDPRSKNNGGDLYYVSMGDISIPEIEDNIYKTEPGKVCDKIFRTQLGFHILKVTEKKPRAYGVDVSHILAAFKTGDKAPDTLAAKKKINEVIQELKKGTPFEDAARKYSDDPGSAKKGGSLGVVSRGRFVREFDEVVMKMKENEVSDVIPTTFGFHIIRVNKILPYPPLDKEKENLLKYYEQTRMQSDLKKYTLGLREEMGFNLSPSLYNALVAVTDSFNVGDSLFNVNIREKYKDSLFVTIKNKPYKADSLFNFMVNSSEIMSKRFDKSIIDLSLDRCLTSIILSEKAMEKYNNNPEFESIMEDYKKGVLLFKISEQEIWNKVKVDSNQVKDFWAQTKGNYLTKPKFSYREIYFTTEALRDSVYSALKAGGDFDALIKKSARAGSDVPITQSADESELALRASKLANIGDFSEPFSFSRGWSLVRLDKRIESREKTFDEAKPEVSSVLQENESKRIEDAYVNNLTKMFSPKLYMENIKN